LTTAVTEEEGLTPVESLQGRPMVRPRVQAAESLIGVKHPVLEHGYVVLVDYMGDDNAIVQAARVSYGPGTKTARDDRGLIRYLMRNRHTTPFEMVEFKFLVRLPMYVARQMIRHRTASVNEVSARYSILPDEYELPRQESVRAQATRNRQGRSDEMLPPETVEEFRTGVKHLSDEAYGFYQRSLTHGVAREIARIVLPVGVYTEWYWKMDLHNLFHFLELRLDEHAQEEMRQYANAIAGIVKQVVPVAYEAFEDYILESETFSRTELTALSAVLKGNSKEDACREAGLPLVREDGTPIRSGEGVEFLEKLSGLPAKPRSGKKGSETGK
jgi:thymidylate synthase (FAD)